MQANYSQLACIYYCKTSTYMPERKRPTVAIVAAHERRKTADDILDTVSSAAEVRPVMLPGRRFPII